MLGSFSFVRSYQCFRIALWCQSPLEAVAQSTGLTTEARYSTFRCIFTHLFMQLGVWHRWKRAIGQISNTLRDSQPDRSLPQVTASPFQKAFFVLSQQNGSWPGRLVQLAVPFWSNVTSDIVALFVRSSDRVRACVHLFIQTKVLRVVSRYGFQRFSNMLTTSDLSGFVQVSHKPQHRGVHWASYEGLQHSRQCRVTEKKGWRTWPDSATQGPKCMW